MSKLAAARIIKTNLGISTSAIAETIIAIPEIMPQIPDNTPILLLRFSLFSLFFITAYPS